MIDFFSRLDKYMKIKGLNDNKITIEANISNGLIGKARKRGSLSQENISKILQVYKDIDANWLLTGEGEMLKNTELTISERLEDFKIENGLMYYDLGSILGITPGAMRGLTRRNEVTEEHITLITDKLETSKEWLLTGKGEMPKINRENIERISEKENTNEVITLRRENELLRENNQLLKDKIKVLETENEYLKNKLV